MSLLITIASGIAFIIYMIFFSINAITYDRVKKNESEEELDKCRYNIEKKWAKNILRITRTTVEIRGEENLIDGPCLFVSNHQSYLDIPVILMAVKSSTGFVAKKELESAPLIGKWIDRTNSVSIDRENVREAVKGIEKGVEHLKRGYSMCIFPEGTRSRSSRVGEFRKGSLKLATKAKVPIIPLTINGAYKILEEKNRVCKAHVTLTIGKPIYTSGLSKEEEKQLTSIVRQEIVSKIES